MYVYVCVYIYVYMCIYIYIHTLEGGKRGYLARYIQFFKYKLIKKNVFAYMKDIFYETNILFSYKGNLKCFIPCKIH